MINLPEPFLGRLILKIIDEDVSSYKRDLYGMAKDSMLVLPDSEDQRVPYKKGTVVKLAPDSFGERYLKCYGKDRPLDQFPKVGDVVMFIPNQSYKIDPAGKYHIINDEDIVAFYKEEVKEDVRSIG